MRKPVVACESCANARVLPGTNGQQWRCVCPPSRTVLSQAKRPAPVYVDVAETRFSSRLMRPRPCPNHASMVG